MVLNSSQSKGLLMLLCLVMPASMKTSTDLHQGGHRVHQQVSVCEYGAAVVLSAVGFCQDGWRWLITPDLEGFIV